MKNENVIELGNDFNLQIRKGRWIVDFWADWCNPCKIMASHFAEAAKEFVGEVKFAKVDVESNQDLASKFDVMSIPTIIFFEDGELVNRSVGAMDKESVIKLVMDSFKL